jgi:hypothetical protein
VLQKISKPYILMKKNLEFAKAISTKYSTHKCNYWLVDSVHNPNVNKKIH